MCSQRLYRICDVELKTVQSLVYNRKNRVGIHAVSIYAVAGWLSLIPAASRNTFYGGNWNGSTKNLKYPPKRGQLSKSQVEQRAVKEVLEARGVPIVPKRDTYKYHLKRGNTVIRSGITNDLDRREKEHQRNYGKDVHVQQVGNRTTREGARTWEKKQRRSTS